MDYAVNKCWHYTNFIVIMSNFILLIKKWVFEPILITPFTANLGWYLFHYLSLKY